MYFAKTNVVKLIYRTGFSSHWASIQHKQCYTDHPDARREMSLAADMAADRPVVTFGF